MKLLALALGVILVVSVSGRFLEEDLEQDLEQEGQDVLKKLELEMASEEDESSEEECKNKHQKFFDSLTQHEKEWVLRLAIAHEGEEQAQDPDNTGRQAKPTPTDYYGLIPDTVMKMMLNGDFSKKFQEKLVTWLRKDLGYTSADFQRFQLKSAEFCQEGVNNGCMSLKNLGGICCPFG